MDSQLLTELLRSRTSSSENNMVKMQRRYARRAFTGEGRAA